VILPNQAPFFCGAFVMLSGNMEALVINGSPGAGKSTIANVLAEKLREDNQLHAVIDVDELGRVYPENHGGIIWQNLSAVIQNYTRLVDIKLIIPVCVDSQAALDKLQTALRSGKLTICELTAPVDVLVARVTAREPNEHWQHKLRERVEAYSNIPEKYADFRIDTNALSEEQVIQKIIDKLSWEVDRS
jgi:adenylylsulfate kinase